MPPSKSVTLPKGIPFVDAYTAIRSWYQENSEEVRRRGDSYAGESLLLISNLPDPLAATRVEQKAIFAEVITGLLEWGYNRTDGRFTMAAYAHAALQTVGESYSLSQEELRQLQQTPLWRYLPRYRDAQRTPDPSRDIPPDDEAIHAADSDAHSSHRVTDERHYERFREAIEELLAQGRYSRTIQATLRALFAFTRRVQLPLSRSWLYPRTLLLSFLEFGGPDLETSLAAALARRLNLPKGLVLDLLGDALSASPVVARSERLFRISLELGDVLQAAEDLARRTAVDQVCASRHVFAALLMHKPRLGTRVAYLNALLGELPMGQLVDALRTHVAQQHSDDFVSTWNAVMLDLQHLSYSLDQGRGIPETGSTSGATGAPILEPTPQEPHRYGSRLAFDREAATAQHCLRVREYAEVIATLLGLKTGEFCFALFGHWGRGKTFLMKEVRSLLPADERAIIFSAWKYPTQPEVWIHLYETFARAAWLQAPFRRFWPLFRTGIARYGWKPIWIAYGSLLLAAAPRTWLGSAAFHALPYLQNAVGLFGLLFLPTFIRTVLRTKDQLNRQYLTETRHAEKLGLQATIGDDLRWLLKGWVRPEPFQGWKVCIFSGAVFLLAGLIRVRFLDVWFLATVLPIGILALGIIVVGWAHFDVKHAPKQVLLIVDDLDRCKPEHLLSVMESVKLQIEDEEVHERVKVAMLIEEDILKHAIHKKYSSLSDEQTQKDLRTHFTADRIIRENCEKLFNVHLRLPALAPEDIHDLVDGFAPKDSPHPLPLLHEVSRDVSGDLSSSASENLTTMVSEVGEKDDQTPDSDRNWTADASRRERVDRDAELVLGRREVDEIKVALGKTSNSFQLNLGPRTVRAFIFRYQLARLLLDKFEIQNWSPPVLASLLVAEFERSPAEKEQDREEDPATLTLLRKVVRQVS